VTTLADAILQTCANMREDYLSGRPTHLCNYHTMLKGALTVIEQQCKDAQAFDLTATAVPALIDALDLFRLRVEDARTRHVPVQELKHRSGFPMQTPITWLEAEAIADALAVVRSLFPRPQPIVPDPGPVVGTDGI